MKRILLFSFLLVSILSCKDKKPSLWGDKPVEANDFFSAFPELNLPFVVADSNIQKISDTTNISHTVFTQFVPDSVFSSQFKNEKKLTIHPVGRVEASKKEKYLLASVSDKNNIAIYLLVFNNKKFSAGMPLLVRSGGIYSNSATIDKRLAVVVNKEWQKEDVRYYNKVVYSYDTAGLFSVVLTETNEPLIATSGIFNPLDTLPRKNKYSADFSSGKNNFLSLRDGDKPGEYRFYVYFQNEGKEPCKGELRGIIKMTTEKTGQYSEIGDPCVIDFTFSGNEVKVKEKGSCGNYRGIKCFFNHSYSRKKEIKK